MSSLIKNVIMLTVVAVVVGGLYYAMNYTSIFSASQLHVEDVERQTAQIQRDILNSLERLNAVQFDTSLFQSDVYKALDDMRVTLDEPVVSRTDPFADLPE